MPLDPQAARVLKQIEQSDLPALETLPPDAARRQYEQAAAAVAGEAPPMHAVRDIEAAGPFGSIPLRVYTPRDPGAQPMPLLIYIHGGGFVLGSLETHDVPCRYLAAAGDCMVIAIDYRMAPEHPFPQPLEDCWAAVQWIAGHAQELGVDPARIAIGGDSAGATLATVICRKARGAGAPSLVYQLLVYPATEATRSHASHAELATGYRLTRPMLDWFMDHYFSGEPVADDDPDASPLRAPDLSGLPSALVVSAGYDPLRDEDLEYHEKLLGSGVDSIHRHYPGMIHGFINMPGVLDTARECLADCGARLNNVFRATV